MWAEARKHEKKLKNIMVDYRRRAERRREFYDRIRSDPALFLQIHGMQLKVHIDPNLCSLAESSLMPWLGDKDNMIDRFDVRAHLDKSDVSHNSSNSGNTSDVNTPAIDDAIERQTNYERYRNLVQNEFLGLNETKFLQQIWFEERFGVNNQIQKEVQKSSVQKKKLAEKKATIAYNYDNEDMTSTTVQQKNSDSSESEDSSDEDYDFDTTVNIDQLDNESGHRINSIALKFGMKCDDFVRYLDEDKTEAEKIRIQKELENEKSLFTGRKSRRERRALKEQRLLILRATNVEESDKSMAKLKESVDKHNQSSSDSEAFVDENKIEFITSFGGSSEDETRKDLVEKKPKQVITKRKQKIKAFVSDKTETNPVVYGPTLPGEDRVSSVANTSFNKTIHSKQRTYRFNDSLKRSRSRSHSYDRNKYRRTGGRYRSPDVRRSSNRTPDRYRDRSRSRSIGRSSRRRSRSRDRERDDRRIRSRDEDRNRRYRRSRSRDRRTRSRSKDRVRDCRRRSRSRSRSRRRNRSRDRERDRSHRHSSKRSGQRNRSKSQNKKEFESKDTSISCIPKTEKTIVSEEEVIHSTKIDEKNIEIDLKVDNDLNSETLESKPMETTVSIEEENPLKDSSPVVKSYYRAALAREGMSGDSDEELEPKEPKPESEPEGSKKISNNTSCTQSGYKPSSTVTPQAERLKKKMQTLIEKQYKRDKRAEKEKLSKQQQEREDREEELREMTSKLRYRRELYRERRDSRSPSTSKSRSGSSSSSSTSSSY